MLFDFHAHPTFKPFNSLSIYDEDGKLPDQELWKERIRPKKKTSGIPSLLEAEINYTSQIHLNAVADGNIRGMCISLYPLERVFTVTLNSLKDSVLFDVVDHVPLVNLILKARKEESKAFFFKLVGTLTGYDPEVIKRLHDGGYHYYKQLVAEYKYLMRHQNKLPAHGRIAYEVANHYDDYVRIIREGKVAYILSVEGINAFLGESTDFDILVQKDQAGDNTEVQRTLLKHLEDFKSQEVPPFIITLAHHQYNFLCGHAPSFASVAKFAFRQEGTTFNPDQPDKPLHYYLTGLKPFGKKVVRKILSKSFGRQRTLIDTKHMSARARMDFHRMVFEEFSGQNIPIVQTHTAVNGRKKLTDATTDLSKVELSKKQQRKSTFYTGSINLFDDEIVDIIRSNGLIGIMLDEKRIVGKKLAPSTAFYAKSLPAQVYSTQYANHAVLNAQAEKPEHRYEYNKKLFKRAIKRWVKAKRDLAYEMMKASPKPRRVQRIKARMMRWKGESDTMRETMETVFLSILSLQFVHIVKVYHTARMQDTALPDRDPWNHLCLGSDYEGVINPLDIYYYSSHLATLENRLTAFLYKAYNNPMKAFDVYRETMEEGKWEHYVSQIVWGNSQWFLKRYFHSKYLK